MTTPNDTYIIAANCKLNDETIIGNVSELRVKAQQLNLTETILDIDPLSSGWSSPILNNHFRSGNGPLEAISVAVELLKSANSDIVVIKGEDTLRSSYTKEERHQMMQIYRNISLPQLYTELANLWCQTHKLHQKDFIYLTDYLFQNYFRSYSNYYSNVELPDPKWFNFITELFRGVDCANPLADFSGMLLLANYDTTKKLGIIKNGLIKIRSIATQTIEPSIDKIVSYDHLNLAYTKACDDANLNFTHFFMAHKAYLEVYTCFPIVPLAFLYRLNFVKDISSVVTLLDNYLLTLAGGLNLAKAPWNNPVLLAIIRMYHKLHSPNSLNFAGIHGNGGLGEKQGFLILEKVEEVME